jgi:hypothetical protein
MPQTFGSLPHLIQTVLQMSEPGPSALCSANLHLLDFGTLATDEFTAGSKLGNANFE